MLGRTIRSGATLGYKYYKVQTLNLHNSASFWDRRSPIDGKDSPKSPLSCHSNFGDQKLFVQELWRFPWHRLERQFSDPFFYKVQTLNLHNSASFWERRSPIDGKDSPKSPLSCHSNFGDQKLFLQALWRFPWHRLERQFSDPFYISIIKFKL